MFIFNKIFFRTWKYSVVFVRFASKFIILSFSLSFVKQLANKSAEDISAMANQMAMQNAARAQQQAAAAMAGVRFFLHFFVNIFIKSIVFCCFIDFARHFSSFSIVLNFEKSIGYGRVQQVAAGSAARGFDRYTGGLFLIILDFLITNIIFLFLVLRETFFCFLVLQSLLLAHLLANTSAILLLRFIPRFLNSKYFTILHNDQYLNHTNYNNYFCFPKLYSNFLAFTTW